MATAYSHVKPPRNRSAWTLQIVRPAAGFKPKSVSDVPRKRKLVRDLESVSERKYWERQRDVYNRQAMRRGWSTWAIIKHDREASALALEAAQLEDIGCGGVCSADAGLEVYTSKMITLAGRPVIKAEIHTDFFDFDPSVPLVDQVRRQLRLALKIVEKRLGQSKSRIRKAKPKHFKPRIHRPAKRAAVA